MEDDPAAAQSEYLGLFRADLEGFLDDKTVDGAIVTNRHELPRVPGVRYAAFCDPSGGRSDSFTLAIAHNTAGSPERLVLDCLRTVRPPFDPEHAVQSHAATLKDYGLSEVCGDQYAGEFVPSAFKRAGITYKPSERTRSEIYLEALPQFSRGTIELRIQHRCALNCSYWNGAPVPVAVIVSTIPAAPMTTWRMPVVARWCCVPRRTRCTCGAALVPVWTRAGSYRS